MRDPRTIRDILRDLSSLEASRGVVKAQERTLAETVSQYIAESKHGSNGLARLLNFTPAYISDIRNKRRKVSREFVERLEKVKP